MSLFDSYQKNVIDVVQTIIGDVISWQPSNGDIFQSFKALFNNPEKADIIGNENSYEFSPVDSSFEYYENQFVGLKESVDSGNFEKVLINEIYYSVDSVSKINDGKCYRAVITQLKEQ